MSELTSLNQLVQFASKFRLVTLAPQAGPNA